MIAELEREASAANNEHYSNAKKDQTKDNFGQNDEDWDIYKNIQNDGFSEDEEDDKEALNEVEEQILELDQDFGLIIYQNGPDGRRPPTAEDYQIRLWADRYRGAEVLFQPSMLGLECAGLSEAIESICHQLTKEQRARILSNVTILGGNSLVPGFDQRIKRELVMFNEAGANVNIVNEWKPGLTEKPDRQMDPWLGAMKLAHLWQTQ